MRKNENFYNIVFPIPIQQEYTYYLPADINISDKLIGRRVVVDFGRQKNKIGVVVRKISQQKVNVDVKPIKAVIDSTPLFDEEQLKLAEELAKLYFVSYGIFLNTFFNFEHKTELRQGVIVSQKQHKIHFEFDEKLIKLVSKKPQMIVFSSIEAKFLFYINFINYAINEDKQLLIMFPSNAYLQSFYQYLFTIVKDEQHSSALKSLVAVYTGEIDIKERYKLWCFIRNKFVNVILSTKIGCFLPFSCVTHIIIDEPNSAGYKNQEVPMYDACFVVEKRVKKKKCDIIYTTFAPSLYDIYRFKNKICFYPKMDNTNLELPQIRILSQKTLKDIILTNAYKFKQTIVIFPYKGYCRFYVCLNCNRVIPYSKIGKKRKVCPECNETNFKGYGMGIQKFTQLLKQNAKNLTIDYIDADLKEGQVNKIIADFNNEKLDVLISTPVLMNFLYRLKFANVKTIYFAYLDAMIDKPNYLSYENIYRMIKIFKTVLASSGSKNAEIILEILHNREYDEVLTKDYKTFYRKELKLRKELCYPPFCKILNLSIVAKDKPTVEFVRKHLIEQFSSIDNIAVFSAENVRKENREYKEEIMVKLLKKYRHTRSQILEILWDKFKPVEKNYKIKVYYEPMF